MRYVKQSEWEQIPNDFKGLWQDYYNEHPEWIGRKVIMSSWLNNNVNEPGKLLIEGVDFAIDKTRRTNV